MSSYSFEVFLKQICALSITWWTKINFGEPFNWRYIFWATVRKLKTGAMLLLSRSDLVWKKKVMLLCEE